MVFQRETYVSIFIELSLESKYIFWYTTGMDIVVHNLILSWQKDMPERVYVCMCAYALKTNGRRVYSGSMTNS